MPDSEAGEPIETAPRDSDVVFDVWCDECKKWVLDVRRVVYGKGVKKVVLYVPVNKDAEHNPGVRYATRWRPAK